jgi:integral membrane sensor domain MASE1
VVVWIALAYVVLGAAGLTLATASGYASPVFPAAGMALAAVLWFERGAVLGIWMGAVLVNLIPAWLTGTLGLTSTVLALLIATGATAQAWAGSWMVSRWLGPAWQDLEYERDTFLFLVLGGVMACALSPTIGVTGLSVAGIVPRTEFLFTWWIWYVGDTLGVLVFAPLTLCLLNASGARASSSPCCSSCALRLWPFTVPPGGKDRCRRTSFRAMPSPLPSVSTTA